MRLPELARAAVLQDECGPEETLRRPGGAVGLPREEWGVGVLRGEDYWVEVGLWGGSGCVSDEGWGRGRGGRGGGGGCGGCGEGLKGGAYGGGGHLE